MITDVRSTMVTQEELFSLLSQRLACPPVPKNRFFSILLQVPSNQYHYLYQEDGKLIGFVSLYIEQKLSLGCLCVAHINDLIVDKNYPSSKIERELIEHCVQVAKYNNCCRVVVHCNECSVPLCKDLGFTPQGRELVMTVRPF